MELDIKINNKTKNLRLIDREDDIYSIQVDDKIYEVRAKKLSLQVYSILEKNKSFTLEIAKTDNSGKKFSVSTKKFEYYTEVIDSQTKYQQSRKQDDDEDSSNVISTPMPGQIVKIFVEKGQAVKAGDTLIIVEAMKMQSEYKAKNDRIVKDILVAEGDKITGNQPLIILEEEVE